MEKLTSDDIGPSSSGASDNELHNEFDNEFDNESND